MSNTSVETGLPFSGGDGPFDEAHHELYRISPEPSIVHLAITLISIFIIVFGVGSAFIKEKLYAGEAIIAMVVGIAFGPYGAGLFNPRIWGGGDDYDDVVLEVTRVVIALSVFAVGVELPRAYILKHWRSLAVLLGPIMLVGWLISGALMYGIIPGINFLEALVMAAAITPTDPILAASVVGKGKFATEHVPSHVRHLLQSESGCNDGAAFPFLYLALFLVLRDHDSVGTAIGAWIYLVLLYQILLGVAVGAFIGVIARKAMKFAKRRALIDRESMVAMYIALALFSTSVTTLFGSDDLLAAFAAGAAFAWDDWFTESIEESNFSAIIDLLVNSAIFFFVGATIPFDTWSCASLTLTPWRLVVLGICILLIRRLPAVYALQRMIPDIHTHREAIFCGWFGPMGIGALFISTLAATKLPTPTVDTETYCNADQPVLSSIEILTLSVQPVTYFIIMISVIAHGLSIPFFTLSKRVHSISRTWTATSNQEGPSWLSRVRRVGDPRDIVINRDDDEKAERGESGVDLGTDIDVRDFGTKSSSDDWDEKADRSSAADAEKRHDTDEENRHEQHFADKEDRDEEVFQEGDETIVERHGGEDVEVKADGTHEDHHAEEPAAAKAAEQKLDEDEGPLGKMRRGASRGFSTSAIGSHLRDRVKNFSIGERYDPKREEEYKKEKHFDRTEPSRALKEDEPRWWKEGHHIVIERKHGEDVQVINENPDDEARAAADSHPHREVVKLPPFGSRDRSKGAHPHRDLTALIKQHLAAEGGDASRPSDENKRGSHPQPEPEHPVFTAEPEHDGLIGRMRRGFSTTGPSAGAAGDQEGPTAKMSRGFSTNSVVGPRLANRMKNFSIGEKYDPAREREYQRERKDGRAPRADGPPEEPRRWRQGNVVVVERKAGEEVEVINEAPSPEDQRRASEHPDQKVIRMPAFMQRLRSSERPHPPLTAQIKAALAKEQPIAGSSGMSPARPADTAGSSSLSPPDESHELKMEGTSSSGSSKGKEKAVDQDDVSPSDFASLNDNEGKSAALEPPPRRQQSDAHLPTLHESGRSGQSMDLRRAAVERSGDFGEERGRLGTRSAAPSAPASRNPSPSRASIRFDIPLTDTHRSGTMRSAAQQNTAHKEKKEKKGKKGDLSLRRH